MSSPLPVLAVVFAAFCVWLTVRIINRRERWAKRTALALALAATYPLSFGPVSWLLDSECLSRRSQRYLDVIYLPLGFAMDWSPAIRRTLRDYQDIWMPRLCVRDRG